MSLPTTADVFVNWVPVSCMPSPESPAKRIVTVSTSSRCFSGDSTGGSITVLMWLVFKPFQEFPNIADCQFQLPITCGSSLNQSPIGIWQLAIENRFIRLLHYPSPDVDLAVDS